MKLEDIDKLAETKCDLEQIAAREQRAREARKLGVVTPSSRPAGMAYHGGDAAVLVSPTDDEELVEEVRRCGPPCSTGAPGAVAAFVPRWRTSAWRLPTSDTKRPGGG